MPEHGALADVRVHQVAIVEDHVLQRHRTAEILAGQPDLRVVATCASLPEFLAWLARTRSEDRPQLLVLDLGVDRGPGADPQAVARLVRAGLRVLVLSALTARSQVRAVLRAGVAGVVSKSDPEEHVLEAVWTVLGGREWTTPELAGAIAADATRPELSDQEERVLQLYASGLTLAMVATALGIRVETAKTYLARIRTKYAAVDRPARSKLELSRVATEDGYLSDPRQPACSPG